MDPAAPIRIRGGGCSGSPAVASRGNDYQSWCVGQRADGEDRVGVGEAVRDAPASGGEAVRHPAVAGLACRVVQEGRPREAGSLR